MTYVTITNFLSHPNDSPNISTCTCTYSSLDHVVPTETHPTNKIKNVYNSLGINLHDHSINGNECISSTNTSTREIQ